MKQYERYKDSGIQWLGDIPRHWSVVPLKYNLSLKGRIGWNGLKSDEFKEDSYAYLVTGQDFTKADIDWSKCYQIDKDRYDEDPFIQLANGDLLVTKDGTIGKVAKVSGLDKPACLNSGIFVIKQIKKAFIQDYLYWTFVSNQLVDFNNFNSTGSTIQHLYQNVFENMPLLVPTIDEQQAIASYLDYKVGQIDAAIKEKGGMLEDLEAYRTAIISEAVTKGLDKNVEMKDSGIDWIGKIPSNWDIVKLSWVYPNIGSGTTPDTNNNNYYTDEGINWLQTGDLNDGEIIETSKHITELALKERSLRLYPKGSLVIAMYGATIGKVGILQIDTTTNQACCVLPPNEIMSILYTKFTLQAAKEYLLQQSVGGGQPNISQAIIKSLLIPMPSLEEQRKIADYLQSRYEQIEKTASELQSSIEDLKSYKSSLISEAVTGKVDLREWNSKTVTA